MDFFNNLSIAPVDVVFIIVSLILIIRCTIRGFIAEFISVSSVAGGVIFGFIFSGALTSYVLSLGIKWWNKLISFLFIFLVVYVIIKLLGKVFDMIIEKIRLEKLDHALGLFAGILESAIFILVVVTIIDAQPFFQADTILSDSVLAGFARKIITLMPGNVPADFTALAQACSWWFYV